MRMKPASRGASRGFGPRLSIRVRLRVYLPVDIGGALIGGIRHLRVFILIHTDRTGGSASHPTARTHTASSSVQVQSGQVARAQHARTHSTLAPAFPPTRPLPHCNYSCAASVVCS